MYGILKIQSILLVAALLSCLAPSDAAAGFPYVIVDTGQRVAFDNTGPIDSPAPGAAFFGQDANYQGNQPAYRDNGDGTVTDLNTGLMWVKARGQKTTWEQAMAGARTCRTGGYSDWRAPTIKELYSLIDFNGMQRRSISESVPYIDTRYFGFAYGDESRGERLIDCQDWSSSKYIGSTMGGNPTAFGVNFADGRIKGYPIVTPRGEHKLYVRYVRGNPEYGKNHFQDNGDGTVTDLATGLTWQQADSGKGLNWEQALAYAQALNLAGHGDWRLPNAKELESIADYSRSPALNPVFGISDKKAYYWSSTTHLDGGRADQAAYVAFGPAMGFLGFQGRSKQLMDVHGAGAQRSDPKSGDPGDYPQGRGPQGDDIRIYNYVRCVRGGAAQEVASQTPPASLVRVVREASQRMGPMGMGNMPGPGMGPMGMGNMPGPGMGPMGAGNRPGQGMGMGQPRGGRPGRFQISTANQSQMGTGPGAGAGMGRRPPQEALDACRGLGQGTNCSFQSPRGRVDGICRSLQGQSVCAPGNGPGGQNAGPGQRQGQGGYFEPGGPNNGPPSGQRPPGRQNNGGPGKPPAQAIASCRGQAQGSSCSFQSPEGAVSGICRTIGGANACVPANGPRPGGNNPAPGGRNQNPPMWQ